jgi:hypothetical protein
MTSHKKAGRSRSRRRSRSSDDRSSGALLSAAKRRRERVGEVLSTTPRRVLALAAAVGTITGAIAGVLALLPKSPEALSASFSDVTAYPEVSLEQYDAREGSAIVGASHTASAGVLAYRLAADTTSLPTSTAATEEGQTTGSTDTTSTTPPATTSTTTTSEGRSTTSTRAPTHTTSTTTSSTGPAESPAKPGEPPLKRRGKPVGIAPQKGPKRAGGRIRRRSPSAPYPQEEPVAPKAVTATPPPQSLHPVEGALLSEGAGVSKGEVSQVLSLLEQAPPKVAEQGSSEGEATSGTEPTSAPPPIEAPTTSTAPGSSAQVVLPSRCRSAVCGATQEIERALTYDPNPVKAAQAVAAVFNDSRAEVVGKRLYPIGAMVAYNVSLQGFANREATLEWSLIGKANRRPLPRPWWRNIVVAHIKPVVNDESLDGTFWVPVPPEHGDYLVHLVLLDGNGVAHASSDSAPAFH